MKPWTGRTAKAITATLAIALALLVLCPTVRAAEDAKNPPNATTAKAPAGAQDTLAQYVADLQKNPKDGVLRAKIIELALKMDPAPAIPEESDKYFSRGNAAFKAAKSESDFKDAAVEYAKAADLAPWRGDAYWNLASMQDKSGQYDAALNSLAWYLATKPAAADVKAAKALTAEIEFRKEKAAKDAVVEVQKKAEEGAKKKAEAEAAARKKAEAEGPEAIAAKKQQEYDAWLKKLDGVRFARDFGDTKYFFVIRGNHVTLFLTYDRVKNYPQATSVIQGREFQSGHYTCTISEDGSSILNRSNDDGSVIVYPREER